MTSFQVRQGANYNRPLSRRLDRMIQKESRDPNGGNVYYVTMQIIRDASLSASCAFSSSFSYGSQGYC